MNQNIPSYGHNINSLSQNHHMVTQHHNTNPQPFNNITNMHNEKQNYYRDVDTHTIDLTNVPSASTSVPSRTESQQSNTFGLHTANHRQSNNPQILEQMRYQVDHDTQMNRTPSSSTTPSLLSNKTSSSTTDNTSSQQTKCVNNMSMQPNANTSHTINRQIEENQGSNNGLSLISNVSSLMQEKTEDDNVILNGKENITVNGDTGYYHNEVPKNELVALDMGSGLITVNEDMEGNEEEIYETKKSTPNPITWEKKYVEAKDFVTGRREFDKNDIKRIKQWMYNNRKLNLSQVQRCKGWEIGIFWVYTDQQIIESYELLKATNTINVWKRRYLHKRSRFTTEHKNKLIQMEIFKEDELEKPILKKPNRKRKHS